MYPNYCSLLEDRRLSQFKALTEYADKGMGYLLSTAGGGDWIVKPSVRQAAAGLLLRRLYSSRYAMPELSEMDQKATNNLVDKVLLHMEYVNSEKSI